MKVRVLSDLHLEFQDDFYLEIPEGDVLILAGDICLAADYDNYHPFFEQCVAKYNKVFYVLYNAQCEDIVVYHRDVNLYIYYLIFSLYNNYLYMKEMYLLF